MLAIRLTRMGAKKKPFYRIIVTEKRSKRDGRFVESIGYYDPCRNPADVKIDHERMSYWIERGAQPSDTVRSLINRNTEPPSYRHARNDARRKQRDLSSTGRVARPSFLTELRRRRRMNDRSLKEVIETIAKALVDHPDDVVGQRD